MTKNRKEVEIDVEFDFTGYPDYYSGHGHAFSPENLIACLQFGIPINYGETVGEIVNEVLNDVNSQEPWVLVPQFENLVRNLSERRIRKAIWATFPEKTKKTDKFFNEPQLEQEMAKEAESEDFCESPMLIGYIHVYLTEKEQKPYRIA